MNLADCYRVLGLRSGASFSEIKASYRRLARQYHPDANPGDRQAQDKFIELTEAYKFLLSVVDKSGVDKSETVEKVSNPEQTGAVSPPQPSVTKVTRKETPKDTPIQKLPDLSITEQQLKWSSYQQLQQLLKNRRFPRAIALIEGLAQRLPEDPEVRQWQAIAYQRWGRQLIAEKQLEKARIYLKKALKTDPHNRSLWAEVERDFRRLEQIF
ncbi:J domain-containing protein [Coleofasciculus sp. FACHB-1120]|uniref:J domain-containing protein n=1 Tax=Coleofasciculus sp. FACHB-1120 TaxID=2692783 RepID=UPI00168272CA|nr:J domain-containing protein [Coleofasciculus sp. FACHB-1120]MBD2744415.1 DnaJ domain-containing protein [Coleofasciculus sp. FACHB-1120]